MAGQDGADRVEGFSTDVVRSVGDRIGVEGSVPGAGGVGLERRPRGAARRLALEDDLRDSGALGRGGEGDDASHQRAEVTERHARDGGVDGDEHRDRGRRVTRRVGSGGAELVEAGQRARVPEAFVRGDVVRGDEVKAPPPAADLNVTEATPDPRSEASEPRCTFGPPTTAPVGGSLMETEGTVLSTRAVRSGLVPPKPPGSVATARKS